MTATRSYDRLDRAADVYTAEEIAAFKAEGHWADRLLVSHLEEHAEVRPDADALVDANDRLTWAELNSRVNRVAAAFVDAGLAPGDFIAIQLPNVIEFVECYLAAQKAGLRTLTLMPIYRDRDVGYMIGKCGARALVTADRIRGYDHVAMVERLRAELGTLDLVVIVGEPGRDMTSLEDLRRPVDPGNEFLHSRWPDPDELSKVSFTSGTTGLPKGVVHTHNTDAVPPRLVADALGLDHSTPIWMPSPIAHATGLLFGVYDSVQCGAKLVLQDVWDPRTALELISREGVTFTVSATPFIAAMVDQPDLDSFDLSSFRYFVSGGARIPPSLVERAREEMGCELLRVFGGTEAPLHTLNHPDDPWEKKTSRDGRPLPGCLVKIVDQDDRTRELPRGETGEYATWGPHVFLGYLDDAERTWEAKDADGWFYSSDLCLMDDDDFVLYVDRVKDIINRGGIKISALEVENLLVTHPGIQQAAVVPVPDEALGERACAFVVGRADVIPPTVEELGAFLESRGVTKQKWPERIEVLDSLPMTPTGKIQKHVLRAHLEDGPAPA